MTPEVDSVCAHYAQTFGVSFTPDDHLGGARVAQLPTQALLGVRAPMHEDEGPLWRVYLRVDDLDAATAKARAAGALVALEGMELGGGHGRISIVIAGGVEHGLWEQPAQD